MGPCKKDGTWGLVRKTGHGVSCNGTVGLVRQDRGTCNTGHGAMEDRLWDLVRRDTEPSKTAHGACVRQLVRRSTVENCASHNYIGHELYMP